MKKNYQKIFILILIFNLHYFAFSKSNNAYSIKCKQEDNGTTCTTNDNFIPKQQPNPIPKQKPNPTPKQQPNPIPKQKPNPIPKQKPNPIPKQQPNPYSSPQLMETKSNPYALAAGIGTGNPLVNILISIPYIDIDFGYEAFCTSNLKIFTPTF